MSAARVEKKYQNRRNVSYREALHYAKLMEGNAREVCLKTFGYEVKGQAVYNGVKTTPSLLIVGTQPEFPHRKRLHARLRTELDVTKTSNFPAG